MAKINPIDEWLTANGLILLESWARDGYTVDDIATRIGIHVSTLRKWMSEEEEVRKAINAGRELVDYKVENALLKAALGYKTREVKVSAKIKNGRIIEETKETVDKEFAPNVSACTAWLYNRKPKVWKNMNSRANILDDLVEDMSVHITVERASSSEVAQQPMATIQEVDTDWQNDVNDGITLRKATQQEQTQAKANKRAQVVEEDLEDWSGWSDDDKIEEEKSSQKGRSKSTKESSSSAKSGVAKHSQQCATVDTKDVYNSTDDLDYWPDDWEEE